MGVLLAHALFPAPAHAKSPALAELILLVFGICLGIAAVLAAFTKRLFLAPERFFRLPSPTGTLFRIAVLETILVPACSLAGLWLFRGSDVGLVAGGLIYTGLAAPANLLLVRFPDQAITDELRRPEQVIRAVGLALLLPGFFVFALVVLTWLF